MTVGYVIATSHRARAKLHALVDRAGGPRRELFDFHHDYHVTRIPAELVPQALLIKGVRAAPRNFDPTMWKETWATDHRRGMEGLEGRDDVRWLALAQSIVVELKVDEVARAAAAENAEQAECIPGDYERHHLNWDEYGSSQAANDLEYALLGAIAAHDLHDFDTEKVQDYVMREVRESFFDPYVRELKKLRPDLRECGDDGDGVAGLGVGSCKHTVEERNGRFHVVMPDGTRGKTLDRDGRWVERGYTSRAEAERAARHATAACGRHGLDWEEYDVPGYRAEGSAMKGLKGSDSTFDELVEGMAGWMWASQYASAWEEAYDEGEIDEKPPWHGGGRIENYVPETPDEIKEGAAKILLAALQRAKMDASEVFAIAEEEDGKYLDGIEQFGEWLGGSWLGAGNAGSYDGITALKKRGFDIGHGELNLFLVDGDPETVEINYFAGTGLKFEAKPAGGGVSGLGAGRRSYSNAEYAKDRPDPEYVREVKEVVRMIGKARADKIVKYLDGKIPVEPGVDPYYVHRFRQIHKMIGGPKMRAIMDGRWD